VTIAIEDREGSYRYWGWPEAFDTRNALGNARFDASRLWDVRTVSSILGFGLEVLSNAMRCARCPPRCQPM